MRKLDEMRYILQKKWRRKVSVARAIQGRVGEMWKSINAANLPEPKTTFGKQFVGRSELSQKRSRVNEQGMGG